MSIAPETDREAAEELGHRSTRAQRGRMQLLELEAIALRNPADLEVDTDRIAWGPWAPAPDAGGSSWISVGELATERDVLMVQIITSEDHDDRVRCWWRSNGRSPRVAVEIDVHEAAIGHSYTATKGHHPGAGIESPTWQGCSKHP